MEPENSDDLFREKLGKFAREPDPRVWKRIDASLDRRKKRRAVPVWWALGGAAAVLVLGLFLFRQDSPAIPVTNPVTAAPQDTPPVNETRVIPEPESGTQPEVPAGSSVDSPAKPTDSRSRSPETTPVPATRTPAADAVATGDNRASEEDILAGAAGNRDKIDGNRDGITGNRDGITRDRDAGGSEVNADAARDAVGAESVGAERIAAATSDRKADGANDPSEESADPEDNRKSLFEAIEETEQEAVADASGKRWTVGTALAPVYYNSFGDGSPISQNFVSNSKSGTLNFSYGVSVGYAVSDRLSVRSGLNRVDFGYNTNQVAFTSTLSGPSSSSLIRTISYSENARTVVVASTASDNTLPMENTTADVNAQSPVREGRMLQEFGYLEVPVEMEYRLVDKKLGVNLVGGMSSLFLVDNSVSLDSNGATTQIGEATNMNSVSFSTNFGLGVSYNLNPDLELQVQPMFKYHLNTFTNTAGNFQPYSVGVYSGIRYRF